MQTSGGDCRPPARLLHAPSRLLRRRPASRLLCNGVRWKALVMPTLASPRARAPPSFPSRPRAAPVEEPAPTSSCGADQYTDLDLNGGDLYSGQMVVASSDDCCSACYADDLCWAYTFNSLNGNCFLKGEAGWTEVAYTGAYSGRF